MSKRRYLVAIGGILLHLMIGSVYAWSVFTGPIAKQTGWALSSVTVAFSIAIFFLGMSAAFMGRLVERFGPRLTGTVAALLYGSGILLTGLAVQLESLPLLYIGYGVVGGLGLGAGYVTPVSTIIAWFPDKRGLATGMAIMGFGFAAMLTGPIAQNLIAGIGLVPTMYVLGTAYLLIMLTAAQVIRKPRPGEVPAADIEKCQFDRYCHDSQSGSQNAFIPLPVADVFHQHYLWDRTGCCCVTDGATANRHVCGYGSDDGRGRRFV